MTEPDPPIPILTALIALAQVQLAEAWAEVRDQLVAARTEDVPSVLRRQRIALLAVAGLFAITAIYSTLLLGVK
jgi:hypothetical protein